MYDENDSNSFDYKRCLYDAALIMAPAIALGIFAELNGGELPQLPVQNKLTPANDISQVVEEIDPSSNYVEVVMRDYPIINGVQFTIDPLNIMER